MQDSEKQVYYDIIVRCWKCFATPLNQKEFSDEWWREIIGRFDDIIKVYRDTDYARFTERMTQNLLDEHERRQDNGKELLNKTDIRRSWNQGKNSTRMD